MSEPYKTRFKNACSDQETEQKDKQDIEDEEATACGYGRCNGCRPAQKKCECIAKSYFQYGPVRFGGGGFGEYVWLHNDIQVKDGYCSFSYNRVHDCGDKYCSDKLCDNIFEGCEYGDGDSDKVNTVKFPLTDTTTVSISQCEPSNDPEDKGREYQDTLTIGDTQITFSHCTYGKAFTWKKGTGEGDISDKYMDILKPYRGSKACWFCSLNDVQKHPSSNAPTVSKASGGENNGGNKDLFRTFEP